MTALACILAAAREVIADLDVPGEQSSGAVDRLRTAIEEYDNVEFTFPSSPVLDSVLEDMRENKDDEDAEIVLTQADINAVLSLAEHAGRIVNAVAPALFFYADEHNWWGTYTSSNKSAMVTDYGEPHPEYASGKPGQRARNALAAIAQLPLEEDRFVPYVEPDMGKAGAELMQYAWMCSKSEGFNGADCDRMRQIAGWIMADMPSDLEKASWTVLGSMMRVMKQRNLGFNEDVPIVKEFTRLLDHHQDIFERSKSLAATVEEGGDTTDPLRRLREALDPVAADG